MTKTGRPSIDLTGQKFGRLTVVRRALSPTTYGRQKIRYVCKCECGASTVVLAESLVSGRTKSCGCLRRDRMRAGANSAKGVK